MLLPGTLHRIHLSGFMSAEGISTCLKKQNLLSISQPGISVWIILNTRKIKQQYQQTQSVSEAKDPDFLHEITYQETLRILHQAIDTLPPSNPKNHFIGSERKKQQRNRRSPEHFGQHGKIPEKKCLHQFEGAIERSHALPAFLINR